MPVFDLAILDHYFLGHVGVHHLLLERLLASSKLWWSSEWRPLLVDARATDIQAFRSVQRLLVLYLAPPFDGVDEWASLGLEARVVNCSSADGYFWSTGSTCSAELPNASVVMNGGPRVVWAELADGQSFVGAAQPLQLGLKVLLCGQGSLDAWMGRRMSCHRHFESCRR